MNIYLIVQKFIGSLTVNRFFLLFDDDKLFFGHT